jgi:gliding motility-associated-like protein
LAYITSTTTSTAAGVYEYRLGTASATNITSQSCRIYSKPLRIIVNANPTTIITPGGPACAGKDFLLSATGGSTYRWSGPNGFNASDSVLRFPNIQTAQNGIYTVVATSAAGCSQAASATIAVHPSVAVRTSFSDTTICQKTTVQLRADGGENYKWLPAAELSDPTVANPTATASDTIKYQVVAANTFGCTDTAYVSLNVVKIAIANAGSNKTVVSGTNATLDGSIQNQYAQFYWQPAAGISNTGQLRPLITSTVDAVYWLTAVSPNNCGITRDTVYVKVFKDIFIPSAFTPNGDGKNDLWRIPSLQAFTSYELLVYNRFGQLVFQTKNQYQSWDGTRNGIPLPTGGYVYHLTIAELKKSWKGTVMIIR